MKWKSPLVVGNLLDAEACTVSDPASYVLFSFLSRLLRNGTTEAQTRMPVRLMLQQDDMSRVCSRS